MNKLERMNLVRNNLRKIKNYKGDLNCVKFSINNNYEHEIKKAEVCLKAQINGFDFLTEAEFLAGGRADVYLVDADTVIEILCSETKERFEKKHYPVKKIIPIKTNEEVNI